MIKNLLFDLGGVIMDIERKNCVAAFERLGMTDADSFISGHKQNGPFLALESGQIDEAQFCEGMRKLLPGNPTDKQICDALMQYLIGIPEERLSDLLELRKRYKVYMLSNTNPVMWNGFIVQEFRKQGKEMEDYFDGIVTSFDAKACKPDAEIFRYAERTLGIKPEETIFFDDALPNIEGARALGFNVAHVTPERPFMSYID